MPTIEVESDVFFEYKGLKIYHVYKNDDMENGYARDYSYSLSEDSRDEDDDFGIFIDKLPQWKANKTGSQNGDNFYDAVKKTIREAIDSGDLDTLIDASGQTIPDRFINYYRHGGCLYAGNETNSVEWQDTSPNTNNDRCPKCNAEIEPYESEDLPYEAQND